ncbi:MAG: TolC family protein [Gemmataceae bacterium]|nr:TolC family protein [Gemmataceae bacterium]MDW8263738.1 TolC family protein [Gemmataceae bacterium]
MRRTAFLLGLSLALASGLGCKQRLFISADDFATYHAHGLPPRIEADPNPILPDVGFCPRPTTINDPERTPRYLSLAEAIAIALEQGNIGSESSLNPGFAAPELVRVGAGIRQNTGLSIATDAVRVLALEPATVATEIEQALSRFDVRWRTALTWNTIDRPVSTVLDTLQTGRISGTIYTQAANFTTGMVKPLPTGGVAGITFETDYQLSNLNQAGTNPFYRPTLTFVFEQPLLRGFGVEINQIRGIHPGPRTLPQLFDISSGDGVVIARLRFDQSRADFERLVAHMLLNVETAYWNLYGAYWTLYAREAAMRQAYEAWKINKARYEAGRIPIQDFAQTRQQYEIFRSQRIQALGDILERERQLRALLNLPVEDGYRLVPVDTPTLAPYHPDWEASLQEALTLRPELVIARQDLKFQQLRLIEVKNRLLPDLRFLSSYNLNGIGTDLDGSAPENALRSIASNKFHNWTLGLSLEVPLGFRDAHALVRAARLRLTQSYLTLRDQEMKAQRYLALQFRRLEETHAQIQAQRAVREAAAQQLEARFKEFLAGRGTLDFLLEAQRVWAEALRSEYDFIVQYNNALAAFQFAKGTILRYDNVTIAEGPLPGTAQVRAVEHFRQRTEKALKLREYPAPIDHAQTSEPGAASIPVPRLGGEGALPLPALLETKPEVPSSLPAGPDILPKPRPLSSTPAMPAPVPDRPSAGLPTLPAALSEMSPSQQGP